MNYCSNCGKELVEGDKFCSKCGHDLGQGGLDETRNFGRDLEGLGEDLEEDLEDDLEDLEDQDDLYADRDQDLAHTQVLDPLVDYDEDFGLDDYYDEYEEEKAGGFRAYLPFIIGGLVIVLILGTVFSFIVKSRPSEDLDPIDDLIGALDKSDSGRLEGILKPHSQDLKISREGVKALLAYVEKYPATIGDIEESLRRQEEELKDSKGGSPASVSGNFVLRKNGAKDYSIELKSYYLDLTLGEEGLTAYLAGRKLGTSTRKDYREEFGPLMPGLYELEVEYDYEGDLGQERIQKEVELFEARPETTSVSLDYRVDFGLKTLVLKSDFKEARILLDGKDIKKTVGSLEDGVLGPLKPESKIQLVATTPFGDLRSKEVLVKDLGQEVSLNPILSGEGIEGPIRTVVEGFIKENIEARKTLDPAAYTGLMEPEASLRAQGLEALRNKGYYVETTLGSLSYLEDISVAYYEGAYRALVKLAYDLKEEYFWSYTRDEQEGRVSMEIELAYDEPSKKWMIYTVHEESNLKEIDGGPEEAPQPEGDLS